MHSMNMLLSLIAEPTSNGVTVVITCLNPEVYMCSCACARLIHFRFDLIQI